MVRGGVSLTEKRRLVTMADLKKRDLKRRFCKRSQLYLFRITTLSPTELVSQKPPEFVSGDDGMA